jgi:hypothetical protein
LRLRVAEAGEENDYARVRDCDRKFFRYATCGAISVYVWLSLAIFVVALAILFEFEYLHVVRF